MFVRSHIHPSESFEELGQLGDNGVAKDFWLAILGATDPVGQMCDELRQFREECLLSQLQSFIKPGGNAAALLLVELRVEFSQVVRWFD